MAKIKILFLAADPFKGNALRFDEEVRAITAKLRSATYRDSLELVTAWAVRPDDLQQLLLLHQPHVLHFSGHGTQVEQLILMDQDGYPKAVSKDALVGLLRAIADNIQVVVLNACYSEAQAEAIIDVIDCAVGMNSKIGDAAAAVFAAAFYQALGFGRSVQTAFDLGVNALMLEGIPQDRIPRLMTRQGVDVSTQILVASSSAPITTVTTSSVSEVERGSDLARRLTDAAIVGGSVLDNRFSLSCKSRARVRPAIGRQSGMSGNPVRWRDHDRSSESSSGF